MCVCACTYIGIYVCEFKISCMCMSVCVCSKKGQKEGKIACLKSLLFNRLRAYKVLSRVSMATLTIVTHMYTPHTHHTPTIHPPIHPHPPSPTPTHVCKASGKPRALKALAC